MKTEHEVVYSSDNGFYIESLEAVKEIEPGEVLIKPLKVGICGSDFFSLDLYKGNALRLGHEWVGRVEKTNDYNNFKVGDLVTSTAILGCGKCSSCEEGNTNLCPNSKVLGSNDIGMLRTSIVLEERFLEKVPLIDLETASLLEVMAVAEEAIVKLLEISNKVGKVIIWGGGPVGLCMGIYCKENEIEYLVVEKQINKVEKAKKYNLNSISLGELLLTESLKNSFDTFIDCTGDKDGKGAWDYIPHFIKINGSGVIVGKYKKDLSINFIKLSYLGLKISFMRGMNNTTLKRTIENWSEKLLKYKNLLITKRISYLDLNGRKNFDDLRSNNLKICIHIQD